ncbi:glycosyltransferase family 4 protein [Telluribacter sp.]|jgi:glycosyltransferase involved in cell wall biosynthesis|uniref:glycosyltransferase family 4 protein n=1 Tax=Telluribacter sp. TaxID=1978767 RepID=UPI002E125BB6|nr:glycosyltransferase family 4 protein [Telluribacter sp.]
MNILLVINSLDIGGAEVFIVRLANNLAKRGNGVYLLDINPAKRSPLILERISEEVQLVYFDKTLSFPQKVLWKCIYTVSRLSDAWLHRASYKQKKQEAGKLSTLIQGLVQQHGIQVINSHLATADWMVAHYFVKQKRNQKFVISMHGCYNQSDVDTHPVKKRQYADRKWVLNLADRIVLLTPRNAAPLQKLQLKNDPVFIPLGFDRPDTLEPNPENLPDDGTVTFGLVSRAVARKGWEEAILATQQLHSQGVRCRLILVGGGAYQLQLQQQYGHLPYIVFIGATAQVLKWVQQFDVGLFPSYIESESFPNTVIEYLACGKPIIGTDIGEIKNMMSTPDGQLAGQLLHYRPEGTSVKELLEKMSKYIFDPQLLCQHKERAHEAFLKFDMIHCVSSYENVYEG